MIHNSAEVQTEFIGNDTNVWQYSIILREAKIGSNCNINCHVFIENDVIIGNNVTIKPGVQIWDGITIEDDVFIGPNATFTNDKTPRSKQYPDEFQRIIIESKASIGAGAIILGGIRIGKFSLVGAGSLVTKNVPERALVVGTPAKIISWLNEDGTKMEKLEKNKWRDKNGEFWIVKNNRINKI